MTSIFDSYSEERAYNLIGIAIKMDRNQNYAQSYYYYIQGIELLNNIMKGQLLYLLLYIIINIKNIMIIIYY